MARRVYPKLPDLPGVDEQALDSFDVYLTAVIAQATRAAGSLNVAKTFTDASYVRDHAQYWRNGTGILTWLRGQIRRQRKIRADRAEKARGNQAGTD